MRKLHPHHDGRHAKPTDMSSYTIEKVDSPSRVKEFHNLPLLIYAGNRYWVHPLEDDIESRFDPKRNKLFADGEAQRWIVRDADRRVVGRIAAFYNREIANNYEQPTGSCGFFESIDDQAVADLMFDTARDWLKERGMEAMDGPVNFGDRDQWWGLLVEGYELQPLYGCNYHPPYYRDLFENYGFLNYFNQYTYLRNIVTGAFPESVYDRMKRLEESPGYRFEHVDKKDLEQFADDFRLIYNKAWAMFTGVKPIEKEDVQKLMRKIRPIMDERLIYFAYFNDEPIGFFIMIPDLNRVLGALKGKMNWFNGLRLLLLLRFSKKADRIFGVTFGVTPEFQGKGIESGMICAFEKMVASGTLKRYKTLELAWIGDFNPVMMRVVENYVCARKHKRHVTYRYLFDRNKPFTRCPRLGGAKRKG